MTVAASAMQETLVAQPTVLKNISFKLIKSNFSYIFEDRKHKGLKNV